MAHETLKATIRQYIGPNGQNSITGQIMQDILIAMVDEYPNLSGYATQLWVNTQLGDYLPLTGGTLSGNLTVLNASMSVVTAGSSATSYTATITGSGIEAQMLRSGTPINNRMVLDYNGLTFYDQNVAGTTITLSSITSGSFIMSGGTSSQFLKADGSVDSNVYLPKQGNSFYFITDADMPEIADNISTLNAAHRMTLYRNAILMPYQMDNANDGGFIRSRGTSESSAIFEIGMWDDSGAGETIQFNYYPTTSTINPTYSISVPKKTGTIALTSDLSGYATTSQLDDYLPLAGGTLSGNLSVLNASMSVVTAGSSATSYTATITSSGIEAQMMRSGTPINSRMVLDYNGLTFYDQNVAGTTITLSSIITGDMTLSGKLTMTSAWLKIYGVNVGPDTVLEFTNSQDVNFNGGFEYVFDAQIEAPAFVNTSDVRKKTIIDDVLMDLDNVANAPLFKFTWKGQKNNSSQHIGTSAQYWQIILPELVSVGRDADMTLAIQYDVIALASAITVAKTVVDHEARIRQLEEKIK